MAAEDYLKEVFDADTLERARILNVFMAEELISRKDRFIFEETTYVIGALTRNRLLSKKQAKNDSFTSNAICVELGQVSILVDAILAKEEVEDSEYEGAANFSVKIDDLDLPDDLVEDTVVNDIGVNDSNKEAYDNDDIGSDALSGDKEDGSVEVETPNAGEAVRTQSVCQADIPLITIHYVPRKYLNVLTESATAEPMGYTMAEVRQKVREYFER